MKPTIYIIELNRIRNRERIRLPEELDTLGEGEYSIDEFSKGLDKYNLMFITFEGRTP